MSVQRTHARHAARVKLKISFPDLNEFQSVYSKNISKGGMFLATPKPLGKGTRVLVRLMPPGVTRPFEIEGEIAHSVDTPTAIKKKCTPGMGIKFINLNTALKAALDHYIKDLLAGRVPTDSPPVAAAPPTPARGQTRPVSQPQAAPGAGATLPLHRPPAITAKPASSPPDPRKFIQSLDAATRAQRTKNYYEFFGVDPQVSRDEIRRAYNRLAKMFHPDRAPQLLSQSDRVRLGKLFTDIGEIYEKLSTPKSRVLYDLTLGVTREPEDDQERQILTEERARFREAYMLQFPDRIKQAARFAVMAEAAAGTGNTRAATNNFKLALSLDPLNDEYKVKLERLKG